MKTSISGINKMLILSVAFTLILITVRVVYANDLSYIFYAWNLFLAIIPLVFSSRLQKQQTINFKTRLLLAGWLLFLPNAPYIITDIFHYELREPVPMWYDLLIVITAAWNGLLLGIVSLMQVEKFLLNHWKKVWVNAFVCSSLLLCGYGVFIGRFLRFNSWDIVTKPQHILFTSAHQIRHPFQNLNVWVFTVLFGVMLSIVYYTLQQMKSASHSDTF
ncbi:MAG: DUF1361 domain-containing protein [Deinococcales bacterium]|nr:DUF1361 domain-containing protein [Chitinophagaceae bacterium]